MMPPAALARLRAIRDAMPVTQAPAPARPKRQWLDGGQTIAVVRVRRAQDPIAEMAMPAVQKSEVVSSVRERRKRVWPPPGEVARIFREEQRRHR